MFNNWEIGKLKLQQLTPCSLLPTPCSLFPIPYSLFPIPCSLFPLLFDINQSGIVEH
ncbi:MAG: hypothetical protein F6K65_33170 [Moorea sp. SIO3C2]|nr:hypothetical protein [Moorena sp. SIO3C2]